MARIGSLGDIVFEVSDDTVRTIKNAQINSSASYAQHKLHLGKSAPEFTGLGADGISFEVQLLQALGVDVQKELDALGAYLRDGTTVPLVLGETRYGDYHWVVTALKTKLQYFDGKGNVIAATAAVTLLEYPAPPPAPAPAAVTVLGAATPEPESWAVGDSVIVSGRPQYSSYGNGAPGATVTDHRGKITFLNLADGIPYPIHVEWLGWFAIRQVRKKKLAPTPGV
jgi:hypothetical protein